MHRFSLQLLDVSESDKERWNGMLFVDDFPVLNQKEYSLDWHELAKSLVEPGQYTILTCTCGDANCAGLGQKNIITHSASMFRWEMKQPVPYAVLEFDRSEVIEKTLEILNEIRAFVPQADYGADFPVLPVSFRDCSLDWCLRTLQSGKIEGGPWDHMITAAMVPPSKRDTYYLLREPDRVLPSAEWSRKA